VDLYRLPEPVDPDEIGLSELFEADAVIAVEWPGRLHPADHPRRRLEFYFSVIGDQDRSIRIFAYGLDPTDLLKDTGV
jgi:tRNA threonylcarbamoyladenosine biosynthesis protein TsaE